MVATRLQVRPFVRFVGPVVRRSFATSLGRFKDVQGLKKLYDSAEEAVADVQSRSVILSGGGTRRPLKMQ